MVTKIRSVGWRRASRGEGKLDRVSNFHVADPTGTRTHLRQSLDSRYRPHSLTLLSFRLSSSPPAMAVFPLALAILSLSLLVCAADFYEALQG